MKYTTIRWAVTSALIVLTAGTARVAAQGPNKHHSYILVDMGTLGGPSSSASGPCCKIVNNSGTFIGVADTDVLNPYPNGDPDEPSLFYTHAFTWRNGVRTDLGALPGGGTGATWISDSGLIVGGQGSLLPDLLTGRFGTYAVLWKDGQMLNLGSLGGVYTLPVCVNNKGQAVGFADNGIPDPFSMMGGATQTRAFLWQNGAMQDLGTLGGPDAMAFYVNERGQVAGNSFTNSTPTNPFSGYPIIHPFLWENGKMTDVGGLGGTWAAANALNNRGQVVGASTLEGDELQHPYLWQGGTMTDLGTVGGNYGSADWINDAGSAVGWATPAGDDRINGVLWAHGVITDLGALEDHPCNFPHSVNARGQIVGEANDCGEGRVYPFLWEGGGPMVNLNTLIVNSTDINVRKPFFINDSGEIAGVGKIPDGHKRAILLIPCDGNQAAHHPDSGHCAALAANAPAGTQANLSPPVSKEIQAMRVREMVNRLRTQSGRYGGAGAHVQQ